GVGFDTDDFVMDGNTESLESTAVTATPSGTNYSAPSPEPGGASASAAVKDAVDVDLESGEQSTAQIPSSESETNEMHAPLQSPYTASGIPASTVPQSPFDNKQTPAVVAELDELD
ncbi:MAG: hypothetical protein SGILL_010186, partial [Bacillariaceae sp.]